MLENNENRHNGENKENEYYTLLSDIKAELNNYEDFFKGKIIF